MSNHALFGRVGVGYFGIYSGYSAPGSRIAGMEIQVFRNENSSQTKAYSHYSSYSYSGLIPDERVLSQSVNIVPRVSHLTAVGTRLLVSQ